MASDGIQEFLCKYVDLRFVELEKRIDILFREFEKRNNVLLDSKDQALGLASSALRDKLEEMNKFRDQIKTERADFLHVNVYQVQHDRVVTDIKDLQLSKAMLEGKASQSAVMVTLAISIIGIGISLFTLLLH
jgi:hypothetical protein